MSEKEIREWIMPTHIIAAAGVVTNDQDEILLVKTHNAGWVFPGGQVEVGENLIETVQREIREESGIEVEVGEVFCIASNTAKNKGFNGVKEIPTKLMLDFVCKEKGGSITTSDENSETAWVPRDKVLSLIQTPAIIERFKAYLEYNGRPTYMSYVTKPTFDLQLKIKI